jgi:8-oxo-dGTP pyrophosphatase MutT (NUDIX family)
MLKKKCGIILVDNSEKIEKYLIVFSKKSNKYGFPKGSPEIGESYTRTALREFREETGYTFKDKHFKLYSKEKFYVLNNLYFIVRFHCKKDEFLNETDIEDTNEICFKKWITREELLSLNKKMLNVGLSFFCKKFY